MPATAVKLPDQENQFSEYPEAMDNYFVQTSVIIRILPSDILPEVEKKLSDLPISSAKQYSEYLSQEIAFWQSHDSQKKLKEFSKIDALQKAQSHFHSAFNEYNKGVSSYPAGDSQLRQSVSAIAAGTLYSKTALAKYLIGHIDEHQNYYRGFKTALSANKLNNIQTTIADLEGISSALVFRKYIEKICKPSQSELSEFGENLCAANRNYAKLNADYTAAYHEQESRLDAITKQTNQQFQQLNDDANEYFAARDKRCDELEHLYSEKLKLAAPAEYWDNLEEDYLKKGRLWLFVSVVSAFLIIGILISTLVFLPNVFTEDSSWFDVVKNSAILTVITSIAVYILRLFVKLSMSSFHLSRDAKERSNLSYFYLALIEGKAVTDKERAIILNALFSRSDTGLLKGDSSPTMSGNINELVETLAKKQ